MTFQKLLQVVALGAAMVLPASVAHAVLFTGSFNITDFNEPPGGGGLDIQTDGVAGGVNGDEFSFNLNQGQSITFELFDIWTDEGSFNGDDDNAQPISVAWLFTAPPGTTGGPAAGETTGVFVLLASFGLVQWDNPTDFSFGNGGLLRLVLSDETFNGGPFGSFTPGRSNGGTVEARFTLVRDAIPAPEPATLGLLGTGLLGIGLAAWRRRRKQLA